MNSSILPKICLTLVIVAAINTFLSGVLHLDILSSVFGANSVILKFTDVLIGLSAIFVLFQILPNKSLCK